MNSTAVFLLGFLGLLLGSFINALVWRIHKQITTKKIDSRYSITKGRSMCPDCQHQLGAKDLIPVLSWISLGGKCRYCKKSISWQYPIVEIITCILFVISYAYWPYILVGVQAYVGFIVWLILLINGSALVLYDLKWMILPTKLIISFGSFSALFIIFLSVSKYSSDILVSSLMGSILFGGFFYIIYQISNGKWIGGGDVRLGFVLGLLLGWQKSIVGLSLAAYLATAVIIVIALLGKYRNNLKMPFGPFLLSAAFIASLWGQYAIDWYRNLSGL